jgi:hypothetical protein
MIDSTVARFEADSMIARSSSEVSSEDMLTIVENFLRHYMRFNSPETIYYNWLTALGLGQS